MDQRLFHTLAQLLAEQPVVLASVIDTRGATPRKRGARMLVSAAGSRFSVGGGLAEARVLGAARALLDDPGSDTANIGIELDGGPGSAGVCGGRMTVGLRRWQGASDRAAAAAIAAALQRGQPTLLPAALGGAPGDAPLTPDVRLIIVGGGHCGAALAQFARELDFDIHRFDERVDCFTDEDPDTAAGVASGDYAQLRPWLDTPRRVFAVLLNRSYPCDVQTLTVLAERPPEYIGMMGSRRRISEVRRALPELIDRLPMLHAPVGIEIGAQTPPEIAISILAQLVAERSKA